MLEGLVVRGVDGLGVETELPVEEGEVELVAVVIVLRHPRLVGADLAIEPGLDEAPQGRERMTIGQESPQVEGGEHVAVEVDIAAHIGLGDARLVE